MLEAFRRQIVPRLTGDGTKDAAESLFASMITGRVPPEFADAHLMAFTGWSWSELQQTPADVVVRMAIYIAVSRTLLNGGSLDLPGSEG